MTTKKNTGAPKGVKPGEIKSALLKNGYKCKPTKRAKDKLIALRVDKKTYDALVEISKTESTEAGKTIGYTTIARNLLNAALQERTQEGAAKKINAAFIQDYYSVLSRFRSQLVKKSAGGIPKKVSLSLEKAERFLGEFVQDF